MLYEASASESTEQIKPNTFIKATEIWVPGNDRTVLEFGGGLYGELDRFREISTTSRQMGSASPTPPQRLTLTGICVPLRSIRPLRSMASSTTWTSSAWSGTDLSISSGSSRARAKASQRTPTPHEVGMSSCCLGCLAVIARWISRATMALCCTTCTW